MLSRAGAHMFKLPRWTVAAVTFNNTSAMPLLLVQSLNSAGVLSPLLMLPEDSTSDAVKRAQSYFLVSAVVGNMLTFGTGPAQLKGYEEDAPNHLQNGNAEHEGRSTSQDPQRVRFRAQIDLENQHQDTDPSHEPEQGESSERGDGDQGDRDEDGSAGGGRTSLAPNALVHRGAYLRKRVGHISQNFFRSLPRPVRRILRSIYRFLNPPLLGGVIGAVIGLVPPLHGLFFNNTSQGGYFNAWLTESIKNIGELFVTLQVVVVGVKLSLSLRKEKKGEDTGSLPWGIIGFIAFMRFILWPA